MYEKEKRCIKFVDSESQCGDNNIKYKYSDKTAFEFASSPQMGTTFY